MFRRRNIILNSILVIVLGVIGFFGWRILYPTVAVAAVRTATVSVQDVSSSVSATGAVQTSEDLGLNFVNPGIVRTLNVKVGDQVKQGQFLASVDDRAAQLALVQAQVAEKSAEVGVINAKVAVINAKVGVTSAHVAQNNSTLSVKNAEQAVRNAEIAVTQGAQNAQQTQATDDQAIVNAQDALTKLTTPPTTATLAAQAQQIASQQLSIDSSAAAYANAQTAQKQLEATIALNLVGYNTAITNDAYDYSVKCAAAGVGNDCTTVASSRPAYLTLQSAIQAKTAGVLKDSQSDTNAIASVDTAHRSLLAAQAAMDSLKAQQVVTNQPAAQVDIDAANAAIASAQRTKDNAVVVAAQQAALAAGAVVTAQSSLASIRGSLQTSQGSVTSAQGSVTSAQGSVTNAQGSLRVAKANVYNAQVNEANTRLYAPVSATVAAVANDVGVNAGSATAGSSGATGFIVLSDLSGLQVKAPFAEADIVSLKVGQAATFTFDAIANSSAQGSVLSIAPLNNASSGSVTTYNVTFSLDNPPAGVKPGMTAQASVMTAQATGVLALASTALTERGSTYFVTMKPTTVGGVGARKVVTVGLVGDSTTEITSGLKAGDQVVLRTVATTSTSNGFPGVGVPGAGGGARVGG
jgi:multidrug efflux pump subunit AcrA (membrane-fusion protein)